MAVYIAGTDPERIARVAARLLAGTVSVNGAMLDIAAPFGGYKTSGNGREFGPEGLAEFLETKTVSAP